MENATKALMIAAAILITIIIITLGIFVVNQGREAMAGTDLSEAEATQFNSKFLQYEGNNKSTAQVNALLNAVLQHNKNEEAAGTNRFVTVDGATTLGTDASTIENRVTGSDYYKIQCTYTGTRITSITVTNNNTPAPDPE